MNHTDFFKLIKTGLPCATFILHGEEEYVKSQAIKAVIETVDEDLRPFNVSELEKPDPRLLNETCETLPLFYDKRIVICRELADSTDIAKYMSILTDHSPETALLLVFKGKLAANSALMKYAAKHEAEVLFDFLSQRDCIRWCMKHAVESGVVLDQNTAAAFIGAVGTDMTNIVSELDKLIDYVGPGNSVTAQDISVCTRTSLETRIFDMLDMFTYGKPGDGIVALHNLIDDGNEPMSISAFLSGRFKVMLEARRGIDAKKSKRDVAASMEGNRFANERAYDAAKRFTQKELTDLISALSDTAYCKISGTMKEDKYLELVLLRHDWRQFPV